MDPSKEPEVHPYADTKYPSEEEGTSAGQSPYAMVDRDHQPIDVSSPFIDDWADIDVSPDDSISCAGISELDLNDTLEAQPTAQTAQDVSGIDLTELSPDDSISCAGISKLDLNDAQEAQPPAPTARDASDCDISSDQTQAKATPSVLDTSTLESELKLLSSEIWKTVHASSSDIPDPNDAAQAQPTAPTAHPASNRSSTFGSDNLFCFQYSISFTVGSRKSFCVQQLTLSTFCNGDYFCFQYSISFTVGSGKSFCLQQVILSTLGNDNYSCF
ncbi:hypothetical protein MY10362_006613 [Beauveria mimosiformis]